MTVNNAVRLLAGSLVLIGLGLGYFVNPWFFLIVAFVGFNLVQSSFTGICPAESIFCKAGLPTSARPKGPVAH